MRWLPLLILLTACGNVPRDVTDQGIDYNFPNKRTPEAMMICLTENLEQEDGIIINVMVNQQVTSAGRRIVGNHEGVVTAYVIDISDEIKVYENVGWANRKSFETRITKIIETCNLT